MKPAGLLRRWIALKLDGLVVCAAWALGAMWLAIVYQLGADDPPTAEGFLFVVAEVLALPWVLAAIYFVGFIGACGQTPAKMLTGVVVVRRDGKPAGYVRAFVRWLGYGVGFLTLGIGFAAAIFSEERRGVHDLLAGTRAVRRARPTSHRGSKPRSGRLKVGPATAERR